MDVLKADSMSILRLALIIYSTQDMVLPMESQGGGSHLTALSIPLNWGTFAVRLATDSEKEKEQWMCSKPTQ